MAHDSPHSRLRRGVWIGNSLSVRAILSPAVSHAKACRQGNGGWTSQQALVAIPCAQHLPAAAPARAAHPHSTQSLRQRLAAVWRRSSLVLSRPPGRVEFTETSYRAVL